jgi:hypothetical protein
MIACIDDIKIIQNSFRKQGDTSLIIVLPSSSSSGTKQQIILTPPRIWLDPQKPYRRALCRNCVGTGKNKKGFSCLKPFTVLVVPQGAELAYRNEQQNTQIVI